MKKKDYTDITQSVISNKDLKLVINKIFPDSIILDRDFNIFSVSKSISKPLGYKVEKLKKSSLKNILSEPELLDNIKLKLQSGYFEKHQIVFRHANGHEIPFKVSGFYLGLISDLNDLIVFKLKNQEEIKYFNNLLEAKSMEMDDFVYHAAHSLRGPLATLKGLINLALIAENKGEVDLLTPKMNVFAQRLDDKLSNLVNFAESGKVTDNSQKNLTLARLGEKIRLLINEDKSVTPLIFKEFFKDPDIVINQGNLVYSVLSNIISFFMLQVRNEESEILLGSSSNSVFIEFEVRTSGISLHNAQRVKIEKMIFGYVEILNEPEFSSLYAAKKILSKLKGRISLSFQNSDEACIYILVPKKNCSQIMLDARLNVYRIFQTLV